MSSTEHFKGSCHCGKVAYEFDHAPMNTGTFYSCNCSICKRRGHVLSFLNVPVTFSKGSLDDLTSYQFGPKKFDHRFCPTCGSSIMVIQKDNGTQLINVRNVDGVDVTKLDNITMLDNADK